MICLKMISLPRGGNGISLWEILLINNGNICQAMLYYPIIYKIR